MKARWNIGIELQDFFVGYLKERYFTYDKISAVKSAIDPP